MAIYENGNNGIGSMRFDDNTILEVKQPGGGGSGVGGPMGLNARNLITGEDTGEVIAAQNEQIAEQGEEIDQLAEQNTELQAENVRLQDANAELTEQIENMLPRTFIDINGTLRCVNNSGVDVAVGYMSGKQLKAAVVPAGATGFDLQLNAAALYESTENSYVVRFSAPFGRFFTITTRGDVAPGIIATGVEIRYNGDATSVNQGFTLTIS